ncbi:hypothetical protein FS842_000765 [Serendipita sp. 407]|nr:hypothetical protein FS842_000765 [Serendipita sp. 407]
MALKGDVPKWKVKYLPEPEAYKTLAPPRLRLSTNSLLTAVPLLSLVAPLALLHYHRCYYHHYHYYTTAPPPPLPMAYYMQLPTLSEVVPADILHDKRFAQFAPYSAGPLVKEEPASPAWSSYGLPSPGSAYSSGSRTPSLSPSPPPVHAQLPKHHQQQLPGRGASQQPTTVWISQTSGNGSSSMMYAAQPQHAHPSQQNFVWMPTNMNYPAPCEPNPAQRRGSGSMTPTPPANSHASLVDPKQNYKLVASDPAHADAIVHVAPGGTPKLLIGSAARSHLSKLTSVPEAQRGRVVFYKVVKN